MEENLETNEGKNSGIDGGGDRGSHRPLTVTLPKARRCSLKEFKEQCPGPGICEAPLASICYCHPTALKIEG